MNDTADKGLTLAIDRLIAAPPERVFAAWTSPDELVKWFGPEGVTCTEAQCDARAGGRYRLANLLPDGRVVTISGTFETVERPRRLVYSWQVEPGGGGRERVTVTFDSEAGGTRLTIVHERMASEEIRDSHRAGWLGCLDGLEAHLHAGARA